MSQLAHSTSPQPARLHGALGPTAIVFMVVAAAAPLTVVAASPIGMAFTNGGGVPANYLIAGAILPLFSLGFTTMSHHIKDAGAFYAFVGARLGRVAGSGAAFLALFTYLAVQTAVYAYLGFSRVRRHNSPFSGGTSFTGARRYSVKYGGPWGPAEMSQ